MFCQDEAQPTVELPVLMKLQRRVKELEQDKQSLWQQLDKKEEVQQEKAKVRISTHFIFSRTLFFTVFDCFVRTRGSFLWVIQLFLLFL